METAWEKWRRQYKQKWKVWQQWKKMRMEGDFFLVQPFYYLLDFRLEFGLGALIAHFNVAHMGSSLTLVIFLVFFGGTNESSKGLKNLEG